MSNIVISTHNSSEKHWDGLHSFFVVSLWNLGYILQSQHIPVQPSHIQIWLCMKMTGELLFSGLNPLIPTAWGSRTLYFRKLPSWFWWLARKSSWSPSSTNFLNFPLCMLSSGCPPLPCLLYLHYDNLCNTLLTAPIMCCDLYAFISHRRTLHKWPWKNC